MSDEQQECQACFRDFPADDPMISVGDSGDFCSWECVALFASEQGHCWTHDDLVECYVAYARTLEAILAKSRPAEEVP